MAETRADPMCGLGCMFQRPARRLRSMFQRRPPNSVPNGRQQLLLQQGTTYLIVASEAQVAQGSIWLFSQDSGLIVNSFPFLPGIPATRNELFYFHIMNRGDFGNMKTKRYDIEYLGRKVFVNAVKVVVQKQILKNNGRLKTNPVRQPRIQFPTYQVFKVLKLSENGEYVDVWSSVSNAVLQAAAPRVGSRASAQSVTDLNSEVSQLRADGWEVVSLQPVHYYYFQSIDRSVKFLELRSLDSDLWIVNNETVSIYEPEPILYKGTTGNLKCKKYINNVIYAGERLPMPIDGIKVETKFNADTAKVLFRPAQVQYVRVQSDVVSSDTIIWRHVGRSRPPADADEGRSLVTWGNFDRLHQSADANEGESSGHNSDAESVGGSSHYSSAAGSEGWSSGYSSAEESF